MCANAVTLGKRYTGQGADVDGKRTFVERRQERTAQREEEGQRNHYQYARNGQYAARCLTGGPAEHVQVALLHGGYPAGFLADSIVQFAGRIFQQIAAKHRGERKGHEGRGKQRYDETYAQRCQHAAFESGKEEEGNEANHNDERGVENGHAHLARSVEDYLHLRLALLRGKLGIEAEVLEHIFHIDNSIVDQRTNGNGHTADTHGVDGQPH